MLHSKTEQFPILHQGCPQDGIRGRKAAFWIASSRDCAAAFCAAVKDLRPPRRLPVSVHLSQRLFYFFTYSLSRFFLHRRHRSAPTSSFLRLLRRFRRIRRGVGFHRVGIWRLNRFFRRALHRLNNRRVLRLLDSGFLLYNIVFLIIIDCAFSII